MFSGCHFCVLLFSISLHFLFRFLIARQIAQYAYNTLKDCKTDIFKVSTSFITYYVELSDFFPLHSSCSCLLVRCAVLCFFAVFNFSVTSTREKKRPFCYSMLRVYREKLHAVDIGTYKKRKKATHKTIYLWNCLCNFSFNVDFFLNVFALLMHCRLSCSKLPRCVCAIRKRNANIWIEYDRYENMCARCLYMLGRFVVRMLVINPLVKLYALVLYRFCAVAFSQNRIYFFNNCFFFSLSNVRNHIEQPTIHTPTE